MVEGEAARRGASEHLPELDHMVGAEGARDEPAIERPEAFLAALASRLREG